MHARYQLVVSEHPDTPDPVQGEVLGSGHSVLGLFDRYHDGDGCWFSGGCFAGRYPVEVRDTRTGSVLTKAEYLALVCRLRGWTEPQYYRDRA